MNCFVALGANLGNPAATLDLACNLLSSFVSNMQVSKFYWTKPISPIPQDKFLNGCCSFSCTLSPFELLCSLQEIERKLGKVPKGRDEPRPIDLDLLFCDEALIFHPELVLPHPRWHERLFVVRPLADITKKLPFDINIQPLLERLDDPSLWTLCH
ncbi:MAG: 2-amino-4-hydroxy-6-hydroxymethyldihydropteridine pyrophosphokinase [Chlamydiales bacterium]|nr:2-amino-4-hydroxy-6-hydroxymethyldihydropteridine pyrophosphokinase [Chlamydiales bacterium]MCH9635730.1 2-amino-4-hydroxy-6-hydroxymethyldihydropteridine pyrophosphokinase [Chlamydiales bacterium]MCH9704292.1 2-amino-4-hydroxy-6-hydroxymethyldihydropteridine diphosphokinase [Chlamydiota bacterium]